MSYAKRYRKHTDERIRIAFPFADWLTDVGDTYASHVISFDDGIYIISTDQASGDVSALVALGTFGRSYVVACEMTTTGGLVKRIENLVQIRGRLAREGPAVDGGDATSSDNPGDPPSVDGGTSLDDDAILLPVNGGQS